jgi:hypothetical protein
LLVAQVVADPVDECETLLEKGNVVGGVKK